MAKYHMAKGEFCEAIHTDPNCWLFNHEKEHPITLYKEIKDNEVIYHFEQGSEHRMFKDMKQYGEIWYILKIGDQSSGIWSTWTIY